MRAIVMELASGYCNSQCAWCFTAYDTGKQIKRGLMSEKNYYKFLALNYNDRLQLSIIPFSHGEALLHPAFATMITETHKQEFALSHIHSNFSMEVSDEIIQVLPFFRNIVINVGGGTNGTHKRNMGTNLDTVMQNLERLSSVIKDLNSGTIVTVKMVLNTHNKEEQDLLRERVLSINSEIEVKFFPTYFTTSDSTQEDMRVFINRNFRKDDGFIDLDISMRDSFDIDGNGSIKVHSKINHCPDSTPTVRWYGGVQCCCRPRAPEGLIGDAFSVPICTILESTEYQEARKRADKMAYVSYCKCCS